jgi:hypothetical protein
VVASYAEVPRDTIHTLSLYNDAIEREIDRDRRDMIERLRPALVAKIVDKAIDHFSDNTLFPRSPKLPSQTASRQHVPLSR